MVDLNRNVGIAWQTLQNKVYAMGLNDITENRKFVVSIKEYETLQGTFKCYCNKGQNFLNID